jgi:hypothetical protein
VANILFMGFEKLTAALLNDAGIWDITAPTSGWGVNSTKARSGGSGQALTAGSAVTGVKSLGANYSHLFFGVAQVVFSAALPTTPTILDWAFLDGATCQVGYVITNLGEIVVYSGNITIASATELGRTASGVITAAGTGGTAADYKMVELEIVFHGSAGTVTVKVADSTVLTLTALNTAPSGVAQANRLHMRSRSSASVWQVDDLYINDNIGSAPDNTFYGEAFVVEGLSPSGDGNSSQWLGSDGNSVNNSLLVDDTGNGDTDYVSSGTLNDVDTYALGNLANATGTIVGSRHLIVARKDDVAARTIASVLRTNSTDYVSGTNKTVTGTYVVYEDRRTINPDTSLRFTIAEINGLEAGQKVTT